MRPATVLVKCARTFQSSISLKLNGRIADARSIIAIMLLSASFGNALDLEITGPDEDDAAEAIAAVFDTSQDNVPRGS